MHEHSARSELHDAVVVRIAQKQITEAVQRHVVVGAQAGVEDGGGAGRSAFDDPVVSDVAQVSTSSAVDHHRRGEWQIGLIEDEQHGVVGRQLQHAMVTEIAYPQLVVRVDVYVKWMEQRATGRERLQLSAV